MNEREFTAGLVSIITPCYNTGNYVHRLLNSVLNQTYAQIEMIVLDDGSTDNTHEVCHGFADKFRDRGYQFKYVYLKNGGQSTAIQKGLELITGEYLVWPDSDDYYRSNDVIKLMVDRFKEVPINVGMVRVNEMMVSDCANPVDICIKGKNLKYLESKNLFLDCLLNRNDFYYCPGAYMIRTEYFIQASNLPIYTSKKAGQNWQLMLPILYHFQCSSINEVLYNVVNRNNSHSRINKDYQQVKDRIIEYEKTILATLQNIKNISYIEINNYSKLIKYKYNRELLKNAILFKNNHDVNKYYNRLKEEHKVSSSDFIIYYLYKLNCFKSIRLIYALQLRLKK